MDTLKVNLDIIRKKLASDDIFQEMCTEPTEIIIYRRIDESTIEDLCKCLITERSNSVEDAICEFFQSMRENLYPLLCQFYHNMDNLYGNGELYAFLRNVPDRSDIERYPHMFNVEYVLEQYVKLYLIRKFPYIHPLDYITVNASSYAQDGTYIIDQNQFGVEEIIKAHFRRQSGKISLTVPYGVTTLKENVFVGLGNISKIIFPETLTTIKTGALSMLRANLSELYIPKTLINIEPGALDNLGSIEKIVVDKDNPIYRGNDEYNAIIEIETNKTIFKC